MSAFAPDGRLRLDWMNFLSGIEYPFSQLAQAGEGEAGLSDALPELKALVYWGIFDGEVGNGGVSQFYYNQAPHLPAFEETARIIKVHPLLAEAADFAEEALAAFADHADAVAEARKTDEWPQELFESLAPDFEDLETRLWTVNKKINARLDVEVLTKPERYIDFSVTEGWHPDLTGLLEVSRSGSNWSSKGRLQFVDGFPLGPNVLAVTRAERQMQSEIRISPERMHIEINRGPDHDGRLKRSWWDHRIQRREVRTFAADGRLMKIERQNFERKKTGEQAKFFEDGSIDSVEFYDDAGIRLKSSHYFPGGQLALSTAKTAQGQRLLRYWPSGQLNVEYFHDYPEERYINAYLDDGKQTVKDGKGELTFFRREEDGVTYTFTCPVRKERLHGTHIERKNGEETARKEYHRGEVRRR